MSPDSLKNIELNLGLKSIQLTEAQSGIVLMTLDMPDSGANVLTEAMFAELDQVMEVLVQQDDIIGLILYSAKKSIYIAGADLKRIVATLDWPDEKIIEFCEKGRAVMARFSRCPFVSVAAIHGACVGGGLELPLWCDYRIASNDRRTVLGLPEVKLGLVPGWAGTVRLPRIANLEHALDLVTTGRLVSADVAKEMGFVDQVCEQDELITEAVGLIQRSSEDKSFIDDRKSIMGPVADLTRLQEKNERYGEQIILNKEIYPYAPAIALEHMLRTSVQPQTEGWKSESIAMSQVYGSAASRGLLNHFFLVDRNKKKPGLVDLKIAPTEISMVGIVGAGLMGSSIATTCLKLGISVVLLDANKELAASVAKEISGSAKVKRGGETPTIVCAEHYSGLAKSDLVIESVVETFDVKKSVLQKIEAEISDTAMIATNTSAIPISKLADCLQHPDRFCGIHFCHPELMSLVEVICGRRTSEQTVANGVAFVRSLRKMPVAMNDGAGFVVNRLLAAMLDQSLRIVSQGAQVEEVDEAMREFGFLGGPFEIIDVIGSDTCMYAGRTMWEAGLKCVTLSPILPRMVKLGRLGRKSGVGFYRYPDAAGDAVQDPELQSIISSYIQPAKEQLTGDQMVNQILSAMVLEASHILEEDIVDDYRDIDLCVIHGFSFPQHRGGILFWADQVGLKGINQTLYTIGESESRIEPSEMLKSMRFDKKKFYKS